MKKLIAMILAAAMLLSLTACGSTAADTAADDPEVRPHPPMLPPKRRPRSQGAPRTGSRARAESHINQGQTAGS